MTNSKPSKPSSRTVVFITVGIILVFVVLFIIEFVISSGDKPTVDVTLSADSYVAEVTPLLETADAARGAELINTYQCAACHIAGAGNVAPAFTGIGKRAGTRRTPLTAPAYLYESITNPGVFLAPKAESSEETYVNSMPANYKERIPSQELGDIIAYLLTQ